MKRYLLMVSVIMIFLTAKTALSPSRTWMVLRGQGPEARDQLIAIIINSQKNLQILLIKVYNQETARARSSAVRAGGS